MTGSAQSCETSYNYVTDFKMWSLKLATITKIFTAFYRIHQSPCILYIYEVFFADCCPSKAGRRVFSLEILNYLPNKAIHFYSKFQMYMLMMLSPLPQINKLSRTIVLVTKIVHHHSVTWGSSLWILNNFQ